MKSYSYGDKLLDELKQYLFKKTPFTDPALTNELIDNGCIFMTDGKFAADCTETAVRHIATFQICVALSIKLFDFLSH